MTDYTNIAIILAGGQARRFGGRDKGRVEFEGQRLIDHVYRRLKPQVDDIYISGPHNYGLGLSVIEDLERGPKGPVAALYAACQHFAFISAKGFLTVPIDGPCLPEDIYQKLSKTGRSAVAICDGQVHPTFGFWNTQNLIAAFETIEMLQSISLTGVAKMIQADEVSFSDPCAFYNINSADDLTSLYRRY